MDLNSIHLADAWLWANWLYWPILLWALYRAPWPILLQKDSSNILFAATASLFLIWQLKVNIEYGLALHLLGATILMLMFRWSVAIMANAVIVAGVTLLGGADLEAMALNGLLTGVVPITLSYILWRINENFLPPNYFAYIFFAAFLAGGLSILATGFVSYQLLGMLENDLSVELLDQYLMVFIPMMYPEAFLSGAVISVFVIYKPEWIATFDDRRYLHNR